MIGDTTNQPTNAASRPSPRPSSHTGARGSRVVTTALDGTQTVQILDAADAPLVAGSYVFKGGPERYAANIQALKAA